ncbi:MAG: chromate transporter [Clostridia bacterium]|nr:chromate transporter [Clostridia bacterium]
MKELLRLFGVFAKIGGFTFGGGYAMLPMLEKELVEKRNWVSEEDLADYFAIGQCTPGVIAVNTATFVGYKLKKIPGAIFATLGVVFPSMVLILILAAFLSNFASFEVVRHAFAGIRVCVCVLIFSSVWKLGKKSMKNWITWLVYAAVFLLAVFSDVATAILVIGTGLLGFVVTLIRERRKKT